VIQVLPCGCRIDDQFYSTAHDESDKRTPADVTRKRAHYPLGQTPETFCFGCDQFRPCACDKMRAMGDSL
jgi:hypothetical protein